MTLDILKHHPEYEQIYNKQTNKLTFQSFDIVLGKLLCIISDQSTTITNTYEQRSTKYVEIFTSSLLKTTQALKAKQTHNNISFIVATVFVFVYTKQGWVCSQNDSD